LDERGYISLRSDLHATAFYYGVICSQVDFTLLLSNPLIFYKRLPMPQISLYIDKVTLAKIVKAAAKEHISISKWVGKNIKVESIFIIIVSQINFFS
jgi:hypothetical protein